MFYPARTNMKKVLKSLAQTFLAVALLVFVGYGVFSNSPALGNVTTDSPTQAEKWQEYTFFATSTNQVITAGTILYATSTNATSTNIASWFDAAGRKDNGYFVVQGAKGVTMYFGRGFAGGNAGSSVFNVEVSDDGTNWYPFNRMFLPDVSRTATSTVWITAATSTVITDLDFSLGAPYALRCIVLEVTDGAHTCRASARY